MGQNHILSFYNWANREFCTIESAMYIHKEISNFTCTSHKDKTMKILFTFSNLLIYSFSFASILS